MINIEKKNNAMAVFNVLNINFDNYYTSLKKKLSTDRMKLFHIVSYKLYYIFHKEI